MLESPINDPETNEELASIITSDEATASISMMTLLFRGAISAVQPEASTLYAASGTLRSNR